MLTLVDVLPRAEAKASGSLHYFTGKPCKSGHVAVRWTRNGECSACAEARRTYPETRDKTRAKARLVYAARKDELLGKQRQARQQDPDRFRRTQQAYCQRNPEKRRASARGYYARNRGKCLEYNRSREAGVRQATPAWADLVEIEAVYIRAKELEAETGVEYHVDHQVPIKGVNRRGEHIVCGLHVHHNLVPMPAVENRAKSNKFETT